MGQAAAPGKDAERAFAAAGKEGDFQILAHRELRIDPRHLKLAADAEAGNLKGLEAGDVSTGKFDFSAIGGKAPGQEIEQRGPCPQPLGADDRQHLPFRQIEVERIHGANAAEVLGKVSWR